MALLFFSYNSSNNSSNRGGRKGRGERKQEEEEEERGEGREGGLEWRSVGGGVEHCVVLGVGMNVGGQERNEDDRGFGCGHRGVGDGPHHHTLTPQKGTTAASKKGTELLGNKPRGNTHCVVENQR